MLRLYNLVGLNFVDGCFSVLMLDVVSGVSLCLQLQDHLNLGTSFRDHFMVFKGFKMVRVGVAHF